MSLEFRASHRPQRKRTGSNPGVADGIRIVAAPSARCDDLPVTQLISPVRSFAQHGVNTMIAAGIVLVVAGTSWVPHLPDSLWLDETLTRVGEKRPLFSTTGK